jgi:Cu+-exporting ATPase
MTLEPEMQSEQEDDTELRRVRGWFWIALAFTVPGVAIAMVPHLFDLGLSDTAARWLRAAELLLSAPVVLWAALDYYRRGWTGVLNRSPNMYTLIGLGVAVAFLYSLVATFAPQAFPREMRDHHGMVGVYFEVASAIQNLPRTRRSSVSSPCSLCISGSSVMPQMGQWPGPACRTCGCIGQV